MAICHLLPSRTDVTEFAKGRIDPFIEDTPGDLQADGCGKPIPPISNRFAIRCALAWRKPTPEDSAGPEIETDHHPYGEMADRGSRNISSNHLQTKERKNRWKHLKAPQ